MKTKTTHSALKITVALCFTGLSHAAIASTPATLAFPISCTQKQLLPQDYSATITTPISGNSVRIHVLGNYYGYPTESSHRLKSPLYVIDKLLHIPGILSNENITLVIKNETSKDYKGNTGHLAILSGKGLPTTEMICRSISQPSH